MAVVVTKNLSSLKLYLNKGLDENSKQITGTKTFNYVDSEATDQNVLDVANALGNLQKHDEMCIRDRSNTFDFQSFFSLNLTTSRQYY